MKTVEQCVLCGGEIVTRKPGVVAPFLARRIWGGKAPAVALVECKSCSFLFFNPRLEPEEEQRLYAGYRLEEYQRVRQACEPWYTPGFNARIAGPEYIAARRKGLSSILSPYLAGIDKPRILDFGGDRGQLLQGLMPNVMGYVYDISEVDPVDGMERCRNLSDCRKVEVDLIICTNVLEHVGFPRTIMDQIKEIASPQTQIFLEVPFESPFGCTLVIRRLVQFGVLAVTRPAIALTLAKPGMLYFMHEHTNYFNPRSLKAMMTGSGVNAAATGTYELSGPMGRGTMGWCLGRIARD